MVDREDPAFFKSNKTDRSFLHKGRGGTPHQGEGLGHQEDSNRGYRQVVLTNAARIVEAGVINMLAEKEVMVIAAGGGGVPGIEHPDGDLGE